MTVTQAIAQLVLLFLFFALVGVGSFFLGVLVAKINYDRE